MALRSRFLTHTATVRAYEGATPTGADLAGPVSVACRVEEGSKLVLDTAGAEVLSTATLYCDLDVDIPPESEVDIDGRTARVIATKRFNTGGVWSLDHQEVSLQ